MSARSERSLFDAAIESARVYNGVVSECAVTGGVLDALSTFRSAEEVAIRLGVHAEKSATFGALLEVLVTTGLLERRPGARAGVAYRARRDELARRRRSDGTLRPYEARLALVDPWYGDDHVQVIRSTNRSLLGDDLRFFRSPTARIRFDRSFLREWRINLTNPLYEFGRLLAIRELVARGRRFLDLACGLGHGARRLAEYSPGGCEITCVDVSADMLEEAQRAVYPGAKVRFIRWDLNRGLPPLPAGRFDGVLYNGAFHFIRDKPAQLLELRHVLRPGGLLVLGHCFCRSGFADEAMHDLYFSLLENRSWPVPFEQLRSMVVDAGFAEVRRYHRGSHSYLLAEKEETPALAAALGQAGAARR